MPETQSVRIWFCSISTSPSAAAQRFLNVYEPVGSVRASL